MNIGPHKYFVNVSAPIRLHAFLGSGQVRYISTIIYHIYISNHRPFPCKQLPLRQANLFKTNLRYCW